MRLKTAAPPAFDELPALGFSAAFPKPHEVFPVRPSAAHHGIAPEDALEFRESFTAQILRRAQPEITAVLQGVVALRALLFVLRPPHLIHGGVDEFGDVEPVIHDGGGGQHFLDGTGDPKALGDDIKFHGFDDPGREDAQHLTEKFPEKFLVVHGLQFSILFQSFTASKNHATPRKAFS